MVPKHPRSTGSPQIIPTTGIVENMQQSKRVMTLELNKPHRGNVKAVKDEFGNNQLVVTLFHETGAQAKPAPLFSTEHGELRRYKSMWKADFRFEPGMNIMEMADLIEDEASEMADWLVFEYSRYNGKPQPTVVPASFPCLIRQ